MRIIRTCHEMGIKTVAVYSEADHNSLHVQMANEAVCIGPAPAQKSYLSMENIISAAVLTGCDAIHPGYGFLSERSSFVEACDSAGIAFIGPKSTHIDLMGDKANARAQMIKAGVPVVEGTKDAITEPEVALKHANRIGYPLMIKAASGGGGKGMRVVEREEDFFRLFEVAQNETKVSFNDDQMYLERFVKNPKHIEIQILGDKYGNVVHLGERDCSIQRNHQKMIEESPSAVISQELRDQMGADAVKAAKTVGYENAGTIEFIMDEEGRYYFIEMNTRIQVEHPVTEMVTGIDLIEMMIRIAQGEPIPFTQEDVRLEGASIECRINAEDPRNNFRPSPGKVEAFLVPGGMGVRVDSSIYSGAVIQPFYDSMVAKLIVHAPDRKKAIAKMKRALSEFLISGVQTTIDVDYEILEDERFLSGHYHTGFIADKFKEEGR